jgi:hypothetical protein
MLLTFLLALTLGSERPLAELRTGSPAQQIRNVSGVAPAGNSGWLVAWSNGNVITVAPVGANGLPTNIRKLIPGSEAALASTARGPLLVWSVGNSVFAAPLASDGSFAGPASQLSGLATAIRLACNATRCVAAVGATVSILADDGSVLAMPPASAGIAAVAADPNGFLVVRGASTLRTDRLDLSGAIISTMTIPRVDYGALVPIAADFDGADYTVFYPSATTAELLALTLTDAQASPRYVYSTYIGATDGIAAAWNGTEHLVAVSNITEAGVGVLGAIRPSLLGTVRLDASLAVKASPVTLSDSPRSSYTPRLATANGKFFLAWQHLGYAASSVRGAQLSGGDTTTEAVFTLGPLSQETPALAAAEDRDLALWVERDDAAGTATLFYRRIPEDAERRVLAEALDIALPAAASIGSDSLAVWRENAANDPDNAVIKGAIVSPFSDNVQRIEIGVYSYVKAMAAGANGWMLLVVNTAGGLQVVRVTRAGQVMPPADVFQPSGDDSTIASNGANFLVMKTGGLGVDLALLDANGQVTATGHLDAFNQFAVAAISARRDFVIATAGNDGITFRRIGTDLVNPVITAHYSTFDRTVKLIPFGGGSLAIWGNNALRLDASGTPIGTPVTLDTSILAIAPHGTKATVITSRTIDALPVNAQQLFLRDLAEPDGVRRRALR